MSELKWNPRYVDYARLHRKTPEEVLAEDKAKWPGACMAGYLIWNTFRIRDFVKDTGLCCVICHQDEYDEWLHNWVTEELERGVRSITS